MKRTRSLIVLGVLALVVGGAWWWDVRHPAADPRRLLPGFQRDRVGAITVVRDGAAVKLEKSRLAWKVDGLRADGDAVDQLLGALEFEDIERRIGRDDALARKVGLDPARLVVEAGKRRLTIGGEAPGGRIYVERDGEILVAGPRVKEVADLPPDRWRLRRPLLTDIGAIRTLRIGGLKLERDGERWTVDGAPADPRAVDQLLDALDRARATDLARGGDDGTGQPITVNGTLEARLGGRCGAGPRLARADGAVLCFDDAALAPLAWSARQLREPRLYPLPLDAITEVDWKNGERRLALRREGGVWRITAPLDAAGPADDSSVRAWLQQILTLTDEGGAARLTLRSTDASVTHNVREAVDPLRFRARRVIDVRPDDIDKLVIDGHTIVRERHGGAADTFRIDPPARVDAETMRTLIETFAQLRAQSFDKEQRTPTRTIEAAGHKLELHARGDACDGATAGLSFTLDERTCRALLVPLQP